VGTPLIYSGGGLQSAQNHVLLTGVLNRLAFDYQHAKFIQLLTWKKLYGTLSRFKQHVGNQINLRAREQLGKKGKRRERKEGERKKKEERKKKKKRRKEKKEEKKRKKKRKRKRRKRKEKKGNSACGSE